MEAQDQSASKVRFWRGFPFWLTDHHLLIVSSHGREGKQSFSFSSYKATNPMTGASQVALVGKNPPTGDGRYGSIPGSRRSPGEGNGNTLQYPCLENSMDREADGLQSMGSQRVGYN